MNKAPGINFSFGLAIAKGILAARFLRRSSPLAISWAVTGQCNLQCAYCDLHSRKTNDLSTEEILAIADQVAEAGSKIVSLTGGEALMREDLDLLIRRLKANGIYVNINTNGILIPDRVDVVALADRVSVSFDGTPETCAYVKSQSTYQRIVAGLDEMAKRKIKHALNVILFDRNVNEIDYILDFARRRNLQVSFQPATKNSLGSRTPNPLAAPADEYKRAIHRLLALKRSGDETILNSVRSLRHLACWPDDQAIPCSAGMINCRIKADGRVVACERYIESEEGERIPGTDFGKAFRRLERTSCKQCWCASHVEWNLLYAFSLPSFWTCFQNTRK